jgi:putative endonuclease
MDATRGDTGRAAEQHALNTLQAAGLRLVARNFSTRLGEIDLVMLDGAVLVFVEVRLRRDARFGGAEQSLGAAKLRRLRVTAAAFMARDRRFANAAARFDVVAFDDPASPPRWIRGAFA